ncbi:MAG TPA: L-aspartate oxidase [Candidatus Dormibacteraeota bacterium]|jgi:L-aspartate oxidase|nr:L-aspartate oxidase [Candidatus Dormibacteraeota bacterium]
MASRRPAGGAHRFLVIGSGIAGSFAALHASRGGEVLLLTRARMSESNTLYAQGGIAAAIGDSDSPAAHVADTIEVGRGLSDRRAVEVLAEEGPARIKELVALGVRFDREHGKLALGREAAHSQPRIIHAGGDTTGAEIQRGLHQALLDASVDTREDHHVREVIVRDGVCRGVVAEVDGELVEYPATAVILAAGGGGRLFSHTTNPPTADGNAAALAWDAGAELADMEFFQFHPTALRKDGAPSFLISEAVRGEGGVLRNSRGERFMTERHAQAELAPRDVVAREIWAEMARDHADAVFLDLSNLEPDHVRSRFPQIYATCLRYGIDITVDLIPVAPAAHYMIGGPRTDLDGLTSVPGLFACGEAACSGVHGANRLASNSLLESVVFARRAARAAVAYVGAGVPATVGGGPGSGWPYPIGASATELEAPQPERARTVSGRQLPDVMWRSAGLVRDGKGLRGALGALGDGSASAQHRAARLIVEAALIREESRGGHFRADHPETSSRWLGHILQQKDRAPRFVLG